MWIKITLPERQIVEKNESCVTSVIDIDQYQHRYWSINIDQRQKYSFEEQKALLFKF